MAKLTDRNPDSAPGNWYVDRQCIDCGASRTVAPGLVVRLNTTLADRQVIFSLDPSVANLTGFREFPARWAIEKRSRPECTRRTRTGASRRLGRAVSFRVARSTSAPPTAGPWTRGRAARRCSASRHCELRSARSSISAMGQPAPSETGGDHRVTVERYFGLVDEGVLDADDRVELLDGVIVAMAPQRPGHAGTIDRVARALRRAVGARARIREDKPLVLAPFSVPEPEVAVVALDPHDYLRAHPTTALLVVEVSDSSLPQDRLTKAHIYAGAGIPEYWIVDLVHGRIEVFRDPQPGARRYASKTVVATGARLELVALPGAVVSTDDLLPPPADS